MAITTRVGNIAITGIKNMFFFDKSNGELMGDFDKLVDISLSDEQASSELRGGYGNPVLLKIYGDRTTTLTASMATVSTDFLKIATGSTVTIKTLPTDEVEKMVPITGASVTLSSTPSTNAVMSVFVADAYGRNLTKLEKVSSAPNAGQYSVSGNKITVNASTTGKLNVYYKTDKEVESVEARTGSHPKFRMSAICICTDVDSGKIYRGTITSESVQISSNYSITGKNSSDAPEAQTLTLDLLQDTGSTHPYALELFEIQG